MSPNSAARNPSTIRKIALCAAAVVLTLLPTACGAAYADDDAPAVVEVGGVDAAEPSSDEDGAAAKDGADENDEEPGDSGGDDEPAEEGNAAEDEAPAQGEQNEGDDSGDDAGGNAGDNAGDGENDPGNGRDEEEKAPPADGEDGKNEEDGNEDDDELDVLGTDCTNSQLEPHTGFEVAPACVDTSFGEVADEEDSPSLLITDAPESVAADQEFTISVSTRNLIRDRFLGAAAGGYYRESSFLDEDGIQRGHFHTACRMLESTDEAPDAAPAPEFFLATQDNGGGAAPDSVNITVSGLPAGTAQCAVWAGDGSHRIPMMQRANQTPAFDAVRITVE
jgi:hypothetical protein